MEVSFTYKGNATTIQCKSSEQMKDICKKFAYKVGINIDTVFFIHDGIKINDELTFIQLANENDKKEKKMKVLVYEIEKITNTGDLSKSKEIICPQCGDENILINFKNYRISLSGCRNGHNTNNLLFNNFINTQKIDLSKIICNKCNKINKNDAYNKEFFRCNKCNMNLCPLCKLNHDTSHNIINYDKKNYACPGHNCFYIKYCNQCKKNICMHCEKNHKNHDIIYLGDILPDKENSVNILNELKENIEKLNAEISNIINKLNQVRENLRIYYSIAFDVINNYDIQYINYHLLKNLNALNNFNNIILKDIKETFNNDNIINKINNMINIYNKMNNINNKKNDVLYLENYKCDKIINLKGEVTSILLLKNKKRYSNLYDKWLY